MVGIVLVYSPVWRAGFMWDDNQIVTANPVIVGPFGLREIWSSGAARYYPLVLSTFWLEHALWGLAPFGFHLVTVLFHATSAVVLWRVLRRLGIAGAWLGAALWALHPVQVETVSWISETKNTESGLFFLLTIYFFLRGLRATEFAPNRGLSRYHLIALVCAALAMMCKSTALLLPFVLLLCLWWSKRRLRWSDLAVLAPFAVLATVATLIVVSIVQHFGGSEYHGTQGWGERLALAGYIYWFYLAKLIWPHPLMAIYPGWSLANSPPLLSFLPLATLVLVYGYLGLRRMAWRGCFLAFTYYLLNLLPVMGLFSVTGFRYSPVEDHLQYLASMGPLALAGAGLAALPRLLPSGLTWLSRTACAALLLLLGGLGWKQAWHYQSAHTFWVYNLSQNPGCWMAYNDLGLEMAQQGQTEEAWRYFQACVQLEPDSYLAHYNLGDLLAQKKDWPQAVDEYRKSIANHAYFAAAEAHLGEALTQLNQLEEAVVHERRAVYLDPFSAQAHNDLGALLFRQGDATAAMAEYQEALRDDPASVQTHTNLALALTQSGVTLLQQGNVEGAESQFQEALANDPELAQAHSDLGIAYAKTGDLAQAQTQFEEALHDRPDDAAALANLTRIKSMIQQGAPAP
jgi:tetratricopeptide (TPR) repeat protein